MVGAVAVEPRKLRSRRPPVVVLPLRLARGLTLFRMADLRSFPRLPVAAATKATAPVTWGVAMEVPSRLP